MAKINPRTVVGLTSTKNDERVGRVFLGNSYHLRYIRMAGVELE